MSIRKRKGPQGVRYQVVVNEVVAGQRLQHYQTFRTLEDAQKFERKQYRLEADDLLGAPDKTPVAEYLAEWIADRTPRLMARTVAEYAALVPRYLADSIGHIALADLTGRDIEAVYRQMRALPVSESTVRKVHALLSAALKAAVRSGRLHRSPMERVESPRPRPPVPPVLDADGVHRLLDAMRSSVHYTAALLAVYTGMRRSELCGLRWDDVDLAAGVVRVQRKVTQTKGGLHIEPTKRKSSDRTIALPPHVVVHLAAAPRPSEWVLSRTPGRPMLPDVLGRAFKRHGFALHRDTRHTHASLLIAAGVPLTDVAARLGHADPSITARIYAHALTGHERATADAFEAALSGRKVGEKAADGGNP